LELEFLDRQIGLQAMEGQGTDGVGVEGSAVRKVAAEFPYARDDGG
jgi:hypothetical protein